LLRPATPHPLVARTRTAFVTSLDSIPLQPRVVPSAAVEDVAQPLTRWLSGVLPTKQPT
jgi:hypothetical protein